MKSRTKEAEAHFKEGYNCAQSVFMTYADLAGLDRETALKAACSFGGGMGRLREVCGCVSGMLLMAGMLTGNTEPGNQKAKTENYEMVRKLAEEFSALNGSIICRELLGLSGKEKEAAPSQRTESYYKKRPCGKLVGEAAGLVEKILFPGMFEPESEGENNGL